ncbi:glutamate--cysteine ligase [Streptomyces sp. TRM 70351]|uniref:glutamate--cysteine ligase 2 n=1 Tax=Streptomyces sp. TRM 70351 TaxID=3116552 RepID=UPI002E7AC2CB|nr:glutamate--cysteine ligase [Streptomyces sp. TRM 70351]MEE1927117.1 glutamate--cysteine ligase [Streptomyces sp. TRM 70351]
MRSVGVEEELLLVDPDTGEPRAVSGAVLAFADDDTRLEKELQREQVETGTRPRTSMGDLAAEVLRWRREAAHRARQAGAEVAALATSPLPVEPSVSTGERYQRLRDEFRMTADEQLTCGCHVHVSVDSDEEGVAVLDRIRPWLAPLLALSANSPFWQGRDSGHESYRTQVWGRWPSAGPVEVFGSPERYHHEVRTLLETGTLLDEGMIYFDARLSRSYPTVEIRVADVCLDRADTVLLAALVRGLVETASRAWQAGEPPAPVSARLLRLAAWRAARSGLTEELVHPLTWTPAPAGTVVRSLVDHVRTALTDAGDLELVKDGLAELLHRGNGAARQRARHTRTGSLRDVVTDAVSRTTA